MIVNNFYEFIIGFRSQNSERIWYKFILVFIPLAVIFNCLLSTFFIGFSCYFINERFIAWKLYILKFIFDCQLILKSFTILIILIYILKIYNSMVFFKFIIWQQWLWVLSILLIFIKWNLRMLSFYLIITNDLYVFEIIIIISFNRFKQHQISIIWCISTLVVCLGFITFNIILISKQLFFLIKIM